MSDMKTLQLNKMATGEKQLQAKVQTLQVTKKNLEISRCDEADHIKNRYFS